MRRNRSPGGQRLGEDVIILALTIAALLFIVFPFLWVVLTSIRPPGQILTDRFQLFTETVTLDHYRRLFAGRANFGRYIINSIFVAGTATVITVIVALFAGYGFTRFRFRGRYPLIGGFAFSQLFPWVVLILPLYLVFWRAGLVNSYLGLIIGYVAITLPFCVYLLMGYIATVPPGLDEAAIIDGCSTIQIIVRVIFPIAWPGIAATAVFAFVRSWNEFLFALTLMTDESKKTVPVGLAGFFGQYTTDWGLIMSASVVATLPTLVFFVFMQKRLVSGLAAGAVKQ